MKNSAAKIALYINISENQLVKKLNEMLYRIFIQLLQPGFPAPEPSRKRIWHAKLHYERTCVNAEWYPNSSCILSSLSGTQTPAVFYHLCGRNIHRHSMYICPIGKTACIRRITSYCTRTILQKNHLLFLFLN